jgi:hypothetical protein
LRITGVEICCPHGNWSSGPVDALAAHAATPGGKAGIAVRFSPR